MTGLGAFFINPSTDFFRAEGRVLLYVSAANNGPMPICLHNFGSLSQMLDTVSLSNKGIH